MPRCLTKYFDVRRFSIDFRTWKTNEKTGVLTPRGLQLSATIFQNVVSQYRTSEASEEDYNAKI